MMDLRVSGFDWDEANRAKCQKHGLTLEQIEALFTHSPRIAPDHKHSVDEDRFIAVGRIEGRPGFVAFTIRVKDKRRFIRPVTARFMHAKEVAAYEEEGSTAENG
jgi:uncharacterized protein